MSLIYLIYICICISIIILGTAVLSQDYPADTGKSAKQNKCK